MNGTSSAPILEAYTLNLSDNFTMLNASTNFTKGIEIENIPLVAIVIISILLWVVEIVGIAGNLMVIVGVLSDKKMRTSVTNIFIINLAAADLVLVVSGIPDIILFMQDDGYNMGQGTCKTFRYAMVFCYYAAVMTQLALCVERYIAIVYPFKASIWCNRKNTLIGIACIWPSSAALALPVVIFNEVGGPPGIDKLICATRFSTDNDEHVLYNTVFKYSEFVVFYLSPMLVLVVLYGFIAKELFASTECFHEGNGHYNGGRDACQASDTLQARRGVVKMLIASVILYFVSYSPIEGRMIYATFETSPTQSKWVWHALAAGLMYVNSAANPILYAIFSQNFRKRFRRMICFLEEESGDRNPLHSHSTYSGTAAASTRYTTIRHTSEV